ncbi:alpha/beta hydrolase [Bacillus chungangensis]|uniref:Enterochelin esterase-like enzyme n=1 Tax=Bacillus chungangensis TaxID=587633 RepID=A0ABT9WMW3_9BACI|nr:alpha/beta hydrolase-fold protein [Bacillus chungangensis]MDQ0174606.1 enterochelin esterase-like enzyme [Bacillus chungangensis]
MAISRGTINEIKFESKELEDIIHIFIYLPATFSTLYKYSLLITQDGKDYFQLGRITRFADELLHNQEIENVIIVGIPYKNVEDRTSKYHPNGEQNEAYIRFLAHELVPYLDQMYPTYQVGNGRALIGDSMAATVSLMTAVKYPHTFGKVIMQSPFVNEKVLAEISQHPEPHLLDIYHVIGNKETEVKTTSGDIKDFLTPNRTLQALIKRKGFPYFYEEFEGDHTWKYWQSDLKRALKKMFS